MPSGEFTVEMIVRLPRLPPRVADSNKGSFGKVLVVAGSREMAGAAVLCGSAALRGGAGLVTVATAASAQPIVAVGNPCYLTRALPEDAHGLLDAAAETDLVALLGKNSVVVCGPGLGQSAALAALVHTVLKSAVPLVLDADGLNAVGHDTACLKNRSKPLILTPHPGEFARLVNSTTAQVQANRQELAVRFAGEHGLVLVLKGHGTIVTDGQRVYTNRTGNPGMAKGGSGDVLTGLIGAILAQGLDAFAAAQLGVYWHGLAGDLGRDEFGEVSLVATDLVDYLPRALCQDY